MRNRIKAIYRKVFHPPPAPRPRCLCSTSRVSAHFIVVSRFMNIVILLAKHPQGNWVYDLDSTLDFPTQAAPYMTQAFRQEARMDDKFRQ